MGLSVDDARLVQLDEQLCFKLYAASRMIIKAYKPLLTDMGVTYPQYLVLMTLWPCSSPVTIGFLGEKLLLDTGTLTPLLKRMEIAGLVSRERGLEDERQVWVMATQKGLGLKSMAIDWIKQAGASLQKHNLNVVELRAQLALLMKSLE